MATVVLVALTDVAELVAELKAVDYTVAVIDTDDISTVTVEAILESQPEAVIVAATGYDAACWTLCQQLRSLLLLIILPPHQFVYSEARLAAYRAGAAHVISAPVSIPEVRLLLRRGLRKLRQTQELRRQNQLLARKTLQDPLTGSGNREALELDWLDYRDRGTPLAVFMLDLDHFKEVNDTYGHLVGDSVLKVVAARIEQQLRPLDALYRYGGEEFVIVAPLKPSASFKTAVELIGNRLRTHVSATEIVVNNEGNLLPITVTVSAGGTVVDPKVELDKALATADKALYAAKAAGRDRVCWQAP